MARSAAITISQWVSPSRRLTKRCSRRRKALKRIVKRHFAQYHLRNIRLHIRLLVSDKLLSVASSVQPIQTSDGIEPTATPNCRTTPPKFNNEPTTARQIKMRKYRTPLTSDEPL